MKKILFKPEMVRAILDGKKTQTRRIHANGKPRFKVGDVVYVGEKYLPCFDEKNPKRSWARYTDDMNFRAFADYTWRSGMFMPEKYARIFLKITGVKKQLIKHMIREEAQAEGFRTDSPHGCLFDFATYFRQINPEITGDTEVWAYTFEVVKK